MVTLSKSHAAAMAPRSGTERAASNPVRRGPVVLATDGRQSRNGAVVAAAQLLAVHLDVPLEVISVLDRLPTDAFPPDVFAPPNFVVDETRRDACETTVTDYVCRFSGGATPPRVHVRFGDVATEVDRFAREVSATMIIVGSAPHRRAKHVVSGGRAARILRDAECPVLSVPPTFSRLPRRVLVAVDFGPASMRAAQAALLVVSDEGTVVLTYVLPPSIAPAALTAPPPGDPAADARALFDRLRADLAPYVPPDVKLETRLVTDDAVDGILTSAKHTAAELIAVGTNGPGVLARLLLGSVAEGVLRCAEAVVLASPPPPADQALELTRRVTGVANSTQEQEWAVALDGFTRRNAGRSVMLEVDDPDAGARVTGHGYALMGVTYEPSARRVEIMVGQPGRPLQHVTRSVIHPDAIAMTTTLNGAGEVLDIRHGRGHTIASVADAPRPPA
jgi:nucleotide-binding universal stress UspA family protein